ncbi:DUF262 domain-containing protein [Shewanella sp. 5_MG-2023]|uniref:DUF262 domain-containing protein n=1 Tax=Shewanella sp. 5_MG-2023 TaxID=3062656 RepID=UPI0026E1E5AE|nr:DUF262 domain-containing protein [Shewanella sp. 5_MG-2023]MDO6642141.1 DUF262 domain-containing protein [Shewanella sp. 5_MG-2023]
MKQQFEINPKDENQSWQKIFNSIKLGFELQEIKDDVLTNDQLVEFNDAIIIAPDYQREYRSSIPDESSLIESALLEIPIPPIFLASHKLKGVQVLNVVDGQHRLRAFYRFLSGEYKLTDLSILTDFEGLDVNELPIDDRIELLSRRVATIIFRNFPGKKFELEIFNRYNKGTKPLTPQEIRHAVFDSSINNLVNMFCTDLYNNSSTPLAKAYAISKDRYQKKACHENIFVILSILENGVIQTFKNENGSEVAVAKSPQYVESYMKEKSENELVEIDIAGLEKAKDLFSRFNVFIESLTTITEQPFSKEIYGVSSKRGNKYQVSVAMILAGIFKKLQEQEFSHLDMSNGDDLNRVATEINTLLNESHLEDPDYKASTTNPIEVQKIVDKFQITNV